MGNFFVKKIVFAPFLYVQNDQRVMGIILRCVCRMAAGTPGQKQPDK